MARPANFFTRKRAVVCRSDRAAVQPELEMSPDVGPFAGENAVHHDVAWRAVAARAVVPQHAVLFRAERLDGALRAKVERVGPQSHDLAAKRVERMCEQQQL